jgi:hypothetical protein
VELSYNLQTWSKSGLTLDRSIDLGGGFVRQTWVTTHDVSLNPRCFLRVRVTTP